MGEEPEQVSLRPLGMSFDFTRPAPVIFHGVLGEGPRLSGSFDEYDACTSFELELLPR